MADTGPITITAWPSEIKSLWSVGAGWMTKKTSGLESCSATFTYFAQHFIVGHDHSLGGRRLKSF